jgi:hypothetical protein
MSDGLRIVFVVFESKAARWRAERAGRINQTVVAPGKEPSIVPIKVQMAVDSARSLRADGIGTCHIKCEMKGPWTDPGLRELAALSALAALGCGLAAAQGDLLFAAIFGAACAMTLIEAIRRLR